jgi:hypothetical protein
MEKTNNGPLWAKILYALATLVAIAAFAPASGQTTSASSDVVWFDDSLPTGAQGYASGGDSWTWVKTNPAPASGTQAHQSTLSSTLAEHSFNWANPLAIATGDTLFTYVYIDPANVPQEIMLSFNDGTSWEHRAYWGTDRIAYGTINTAGRRAMGALPAAGTWVRLEIPASSVGLEGKNVVGMTFSQFGGRATWDKTGRKPYSAPTTSTGGSPSTGGVVSNPASNNVVSISASDAIATVGGSDTATLVFKRTGDTSKPLNVGFSLSGTATKWNDYRTTNGDMPTSIVIPASATSASMTITSPAGAFPTGSKTAVFTLSMTPASGYGVGSPSSATVTINGNGSNSSVTPTLAISASTNIVNEGNVTVVTVTRTGSLASAVTVPFTLTGTATKWNDYRRTTGDMPTEITLAPNVSSAAMTVQAVTDSETEGSETAIFTLQPVTGYTLGTSTLALAINDPGVTTPPPSTGGSTGGGTTTPPPTTTPTLSVAAAATSVTEGSTVALTFTRSGSTSAALVVPFTLGGTATKWIDYRRTPNGDMPVEFTIPAGAASATMTLQAVADTETEGSENATFTFASISGLTLSTNSLTLAIADAGSSPGGNTGGNTGGGTGDTGGNTGTIPPGNGTITPSTGSIAVVDYTTLEMPQVGDHALKIVSPTIVELRLINTRAQNAAPELWNFVSGSTFNAPATSQFAVKVNGQSVNVASVGFRRRPLYAPLAVRDLRLDNSLILKLSSPIADNADVEVTNPGNALWPTSMTFKSKAEPMRESGAIHVNQEGYVPSLPKKAMVGHYLGSMGELDIPAGTQFHVVDAASGAIKFTGTLAPRLEKGFTYSPAPYQKVMEADFSSFTTPGEFRLVVPGHGASLPFLINDGIAMAFARTYALGLFHQRCGHPNHLPFTRHVHDACHTAPASIPTMSGNAYTWSVIAQESANANPSQTAPQLKDEASMLYPFVNKNPIDVSGGHHDAGDYSKYTNNSALLISTLIFAVDSMPGIAALDNLGLPESGDGISDILQEAKIEADFIAKLQDTDGGFYFLVYPAQRRYESNVLPDKGDAQIVWPKNTSVTAASVAALAQMASSPKFKAAYPQDAARYLEKAKRGWQFLMTAFGKFGKTGAYQKITHYGDNFMHDDELAWAAVEMYLATGEAQYAAKIKEYFPDPTDPNTYRWGWWRMYESYGNAARSYAFATKSGRSASLDAAYLAKCEQVIVAAGDDSLRWTKESAYPTAFPDATKRMQAAGWYFSLDSAMDMAVAYQLSAKADYIDALVGNMNYEGGTNPVNVSYLTGIGTKRQREIVHQYAQNDRRVLPMTGIPQGNIQQAFAYLSNYGSDLSGSVFPTDDTNQSIKYPFYDRWADAYNVATEFVHVNQGRGLLASAFLATLTPAKNTAWKSGTVSIVAPTATVEVGSLVELKLSTSLDLTGARIVWEAREQEPAFGPTYTIQPKSTGENWVEVEVQWPDGRRAFAHGKFTADASVVKFIDDALPAGAYASTSTGGDGWNWVTSSPAPKSGTKAHQTAGGSTGNKEHSFVGASSPMEVGTGDKLFAYVYVAAGTTEVMVHWFDGASWDHRAYWGANNIGYGTTGTASRYNAGALPAAGQWVRLEVPASAVGLEGKKVTGMCFSSYGGGATWDVAGRAKSGATMP